MPAESRELRKDETFVILAAGDPITSIKLPRSALEPGCDFDQLPPELFAAEPRMSGELVARKPIEPIPVKGGYRPKAKPARDAAINQILKLTDPESGVATMPDLGAEIIKRSDIYTDQWMGASRALIREGCIATVKPAVRGKMVAIVVHPGYVEKSIQTGWLTRPTDEGIIERLVEIDQASRALSVQAVAKALGI